MVILAQDQFNVEHIFRLTDDTGMFQHCKYGVPDPKKGYTTDDNARALIAAVMLYDQFKEKKYLDLVYRYLSFLLNAQNSKGRFKNFMNYHREFIEEEGSEDCFGRCIWALGYTLATASIPENIKHTCRYILSQALPNTKSLKWLRGKAYTAIGLGYLISGQEHKHFQLGSIGKSENNTYVDEYCKANITVDHIEQLVQPLIQQYQQHSSPDWNWFEDHLTYSNAVLPWSLLTAYQVLNKQDYLDFALESLNFLEKITLKNRYFKPIGCHGWMAKGKEPASFDEQPIEACEMMLTYLKAYEILKDQKYFDKAKICFEWYRGYNSKKICLIDSDTGGCYDGITLNGPNLNQGAESILSYCIAYLTLSKYV
ncbi:MAG: hypothetical protein PWP27_1106 [Clostridiales bacterium]|jgi:hypothetical protein|nr:hypothetical protein [Clostridiales bacterium]MDK2933296.1 hypothetical protein [Clostridiales bacterium]